MTTSGAFAASLDADSEGVEGKYYCWTRDELAEVLGEADAEKFAAHYDVQPAGNCRKCTLEPAPMCSTD